jgi:hypothetical protein
MSICKTKCKPITSFAGFLTSITIITYLYYTLLFAIDFHTLIYVEIYPDLLSLCFLLLRTEKMAYMAASLWNFFINGSKAH